YRLTGLVLEGDIVDAHVSQNTIEPHNALRIDVFRLLFEHFMHPVQPCKGLRDLSTEADHHEHRRNHKTKVQCESKEIADSHLAGQNQTASGDHDGDANDPHQQGRRETNHRSRTQRPPDILNEAEGYGVKYGSLPFFRVNSF